MRRIVARLVALCRQRGGDARLEEEVQAHLELLTVDYIRRGMTPDEARYAARRAFGAAEPMKERYRDRRVLRWVEDFQRDLRYGARSLLRSPGFTAVTAASLALGIGANAAIYGLVDAVLLKPLPVRAPGDVVILASRQPGQTGDANRAFSYDLFQAFQASGALADVAASAPVRISASVDGTDEPTVSGQLVSGNYYAVLGIGAFVGRVITLDDERTGGRAVAVLSHAYFQRRFGGDRSIVGRSMRLNGQPFTIAGVSAPGFSGTRLDTPADVTVPLLTQDRVLREADGSWIDDPHQFWLQLVARLEAGGSESQSLLILDRIYHSRLEELRRGSRKANAFEALRLEFEPARGWPGARTRYSRPLAVLMGVVVLVLVAACANVASLLVARALARRREVAVRMALGCSRFRFGRQLLAEGLLIASMGALLGLALAAWTTGLLRTLLDGEPLRHVVVGPDLRVLLFTGAVAISIAILFGLAPALLISHAEPQRALKVHGERTGSRLWGQRLLVSAQVALSLILLVAAVLFVRTLSNLRAFDLGFDQEQVLVLRLEPEGSNQKTEPDGSLKVSLMRTYQELVGRVQALPGVLSASLVGTTPVGSENTITPRVRQANAVAAADDLQIRMLQVYPNYFSTLGIRVLTGRDLLPEENGSSAATAGVRAAVINEMTAQKLFGNPAASLGKRFAAGAAQVFEVVGVVDDVRDRSPREEPVPTAYATYAQTPTGRGQMTLVVRTAGSPSSVASAVRRLAQSIDPNMPLLEMQSVAERVSAATAQERLLALLASFFGVVALFLASIGLYGITAYGVACRERELGVRLALGAARRTIVGLIVRETLLLVGLGATAGLLVAVGGARAAATRLFGVSPTDPVILGAAVLVLVTVASVAALLPARRAFRISALVALRSE